MFEQFERAEERYKNTIYAALLEGEERGEKSKAVAIARKMLSRSRPIDEISDDTGLTEDEIRQLMH